MWLILPDDTEKWEKIKPVKDAYGLEQIRNIKLIMACWFTNLDIKKRHEDLILYEHYNEEKYPKYDNYDAINIDKVTEIPCDYYGIMGVPITFLDKYNPEQFEIIGITNHGDMAGIPYTNDNCFAEINKKRLYVRIFIRRIK